MILRTLYKMGLAQGHTQAGHHGTLHHSSSIFISLERTKSEMGTPLCKEGWPTGQQIRKTKICSLPLPAVTEKSKAPPPGQKQVVQVPQVWPAGMG